MDEQQQQTEQTNQTGAGDIEKLTGALNKERDLNKETQKQLKALQTQLEAFKDIDPELARKAKQLLAEQEEWAQKESKFKADAEAAFAPKIQELEKARTEAEQTLLNFKRDVVLEREYIKANGFPGEFEDVAAKLQSRVQIDPATGELKVFDKAGKPSFTKGEPTTIAQLIAEMQSENLGFARHFKGSEGAGAGLNGNGKYVGGDPAFRGLSAWEKVERMRQERV
jgi:hypothetical protein